MAKKFYWLKLKRDFFKRHDIRIIENMENGKDYVLFYLKLLLESIGHDGNLRFSDAIPYNDSMLATITNTNIDTVKSAISLFSELKMIEILDDQTIYMREVNGMLGCETEWAEKKRLYRENQKCFPGNQKTQIGHCPKKEDIVRQEIELEKEIELELEKDTTKGKSPVEQVVEFYNNICKSFPRCQKLSEKRKKEIRTRLKNGITVSDFKQVFLKAEQSAFLKGNNDRDWRANFDWLIKDANIVKVLDGNYDGGGSDGNHGNSTGNSSPPRNLSGGTRV